MSSPRPAFRVLLVDDEPVIRALVPAMLEGGGVEVRCVANGAQAIAEARRYQPDLILLDIVLPGMDGLSVCRMLKADPELDRVPVHMLTSRARPADHAAAGKAGADGFIQKPFRGQLLQDLVASLRRA
jgi:CheY-like chemotaxis protein